MSVMWAIISAVGAILLAAFGELVSEEIRARLDRIPFAILRAAAKRVPSAQGTELFAEAWLPELHHILRGDEAMPITRLIHGTRYAFRIWLSAARIVAELNCATPRKNILKRAVECLPAKLTDRTVLHVLLSPLTGYCTGAAIAHRSWFYAIGILITIVMGTVGHYAIGHLCPDPALCPMKIAASKTIVATVARGLIIPIGVIAAVLNLIQSLIANRFLGDTAAGSIWAIVIAMVIGFGVVKRRAASTSSGR